MRGIDTSLTDAHFLQLSKFQKMHNAGRPSPFFLEWCVGHAGDLGASKFECLEVTS
jgi:hypothetical protein